MKTLVTDLRSPVSPRHYAGVGCSLMAVKYVVEALATWFHAGSWPMPWEFLAPFASLRLEAWGGAPEWMAWVFAIWTVPFIVIGATLSVRRCIDSDVPPWIGLLFFVPLVNYLLMIALCFLPTATATRTAPPGDLAPGTTAALAGVLAGGSLALGMVLFSVFLLGEYATTLFIGTPFVMGVVASWVYNRPAARPWLGNMGLGVATVAVTGGLLLLFALEGAICVAMAVPLAIPLALSGVVLGRTIATVSAGRAMVAQGLLLPILGIAEPHPAPDVRVVTSEVIVSAAPDAVWDAVITLGGVPLDPPTEWYFRAGIAYPKDATIEGVGVGAIRRCNFSTGSFVEPITAWNPPTLLAFDVAENPPTMAELSPWPTVYAPHLDGILLSKRGEFRIEPIDADHTRLVGTTWYTFEMAPAVYWTLWSDATIHAIHLRVLRHVARAAEG